jgi:FkbM family methyltransferase
VDRAFEKVVEENRQLRKQLRTLHERVKAFESSRWWRVHPRYLLKRLRSQREPVNHAAQFASAEKVKRIAHSWTLKADYERRNANREADEVVIRNGIRLRVHPESVSTFEEFCYSAPEQVQELDAFIANTRDRWRLLDIGAHYGAFSLVFTSGDLTKQALAVDASPIAFAKLLYNIHRNSASSRITAVECALSNERGVLQMHYEWGVQAVAGLDRDSDAVLLIDSETGDRLCERYSYDPDTIKIDVEGHELRVIQGLERMLRRHRPLLFVEVHPRLIATDPRNGTLPELVDELRSFGYSRAELRGSVVPVETLSELVDIERVLLRPDVGE